MTLPQLIRDAVGLHLVWGQWTVSRSRFWFPMRSHVKRYAHMGATVIDDWWGLGLHINRVRQR